MARKLTETRQKMLMNVRQGRDVYDGFENSSYGGAMRSLQTLRGAADLVRWDPRFETWKLTDKGAKALETGEY